MGNIAERTRTRPAREDRKPAYLAFAKVGKGWEKIGAAWHVKSGDDVFSIQLNTMPLNWDGRFILANPENGMPDESDHD